MNEAQRKVRVQGAIVAYTRGRIPETEFRDELRKSGVRPEIIERLATAVKDNLIGVPRELRETRH